MMNVFRALMAPLACAGLLLSACAPLPTPEAQPDTQWLRVEIAPSLANHTDLFSACTPEGVGLVLQQAPGTSFAPEQADLALTWGQPSGDQWKGYAAELASDELAVVVHPQNGMNAIQLSALHLTYTGQLPDWNWDYLGQPAAPLTAYAYPPASDLHILTASGLLAEGQAFDREVALVPGPQEMRAAIAQDLGGIGFLPRSWVDEQVKVLQIEGAPPETWTQPVLSISSQEPQGAARDWLTCVQAGLR